MATLDRASRQWASRPDDERFTSLPDMQAHFNALRMHSLATVIPSRSLALVPCEDNKGLQIAGPAGVAYDVNHWAFGQVAQLADSPAGYLRTLPSPLAADCLNYGLQYRRDVEDVGVLISRDPGGVPVLRAATGPRYGRIWNADITSGLINQFGDGLTGAFKVPGEFSQDVTVTKANTTLYASDRDMFVFLADEKNRIEVPNRRGGEAGTLARGFFVWNSEVGAATFGVSTFLFDYVCANRMVWGAEGYKEITIRHTASAPVRFLEEITPALQRYADSETHSITKAIANARDTRLDQTGTSVSEFLAKRFNKRQVVGIMAAHEADEGRPIETLYDAVNGVTSYARDIPYQDARVELEREAGRIFDMVA